MEYGATSTYGRQMVGRTFRHDAFQAIANPVSHGTTQEGPGMLKLRSRASAVIAGAALVTTGATTGLTLMTAAPADAFTCHPVLVHNGSDYLDDYGGGSQAYVHTYTYTDSPNQTWCLEVASQGGYYFHPQNNTGLCLDAHTYNSGQQIWVYTCNGTQAQRWCWNGTGYIVTRGNSGLALTDNGLYSIATIDHGGANQWSYAQNTAPPPDNC